MIEIILAYLAGIFTGFLLIVMLAYSTFKKLLRALSQLDEVE